ncbi:MAG: di-trans,poly-cis-decaprenylcistransferase [Parcubacteria group bacterium CG08_land_8_20_14_0_20_38_56]|nr:MAG: di-trans,poly-cis-decaprenylcistransferase [Parcubacteria group bacterium CG08_land_8_20_14_0_20_38_56]
MTQNLPIHSTNSGLTLSRIKAPKHIAIIPDGNRRWAKKRWLLPWQGHLAGIKSLKKILKTALELKIPYFTFWAGSCENLTRRSKIEINFLFKLYEKYFLKIAKDRTIHENQIKLNIFGRWKELVPPKTKETIEKAINLTKNYNKYYLTILVAYNGTDEMLGAVKNIVELSKTKAPDITPDLIKENLWTGDLPPVDLLIRTGGEPHNSTGFMMWLTCDSQFYFTETLWPDFSEKEFKEAIEEYQKKERRFGA